MEEFVACPVIHAAGLCEGPQTPSSLSVLLFSNKSLKSGKDLSQSCFCFVTIYVLLWFL